MTTYEHRPTKIGETPLLTDATGTQMVVMKDGRVSRLPFASYQTNMQGYLDAAEDARDVAIEKRDDAVEAADAAVPAAATSVAQAAIATTKAAEALASQGVATTGAGTATTKAAEAVAKALEATQARDAVMAAAVAAGSGPATTLLYPALNKILASATDIVAVRVYETRQDSDGGAWRFKCEHTSWYQETLNTATRGAKREPPAVMGIVLRSVSTSASNVLIYDLTDLDGSGVPRLWMGFSALGLINVAPGTRDLSSIKATQGRIYISSAGTAGRLFEISFPDDRVNIVDSNSTRLGRTIGERNTAGLTGVFTNTARALVSADVKHVDARVLPGAALDAAGLPIPTVLVSTAAGASVIHPNGAVYDITASGGYSRGIFLPDGRLMLSRLASDVVEFGPVPYADVTNSAWRSSFGASNFAASGFGNAFRFAGTTGAQVMPGAIGSTVGVNFLAEDVGNPAGSMTANAAINYATGWLPGGEAIRGAYLCDATTGNITGSNVANETFASGVDGYAAFGDGVVSAPSGRLILTSGGAPAVLPRAFKVYSGLVVGQTYFVKADVPTVAGSVQLSVSTSTSTAGNLGAAPAITSAGTPQFQFTATATSHTLIVLQASLTAGLVVEVDNITIDLAVPDRSYKGKGLIPVGTLSRTAVAAGADMVAFSGFSASNYLTQPYNADLDFGTGDFMIAFWANTTAPTGNRGLFERNSASHFIRIGIGSSTWQFLCNDGTSATVVSTSAPVDGPMQLVVCARRAGVSEIWINGVREGSTTNTKNLSDPDATCFLGINAALTGPFLGTIAMFRTAAYAPTPAQIAKMYRDELPLFQPGVKCLLGGTSNAVADMGFDTTRNELIVGTADGVSEFSGLVRTSYIDTVSSGVLTNDNMRAVASQAGHRLFAGGAEVVAQRDAINGIDVMTRARPPAPERFIARGRTTDATPTNLAPRVFVGERELVRFKMRVIGKMVGAAASERFGTIIDCQAYRDAGGVIEITDIPAASQKLARWNGSAAVENTAETTSTMEAAFVRDTTAHTIAVQVTGKAATTMIWRAEIIGPITRESEDTSYAA